jgi:site-specific recombinase XerD
MTEDIAANLAGFMLHLEAENRAPRTRTTYAEAVRALDDFLSRTGMPRLVANIRREHIEAFQVSLQQKGAKPTTVANRHRSLVQFFRWVKEEGEVRESPMANMRPPDMGDQKTDFPTPEQMRKLLAACDGHEFDARRDTALLRLLMATGMRRAECAGLKVEDVDVLGDKTARVMGKGRRERVCPFDARTAQAILRYLRLRDKHPDGELPWLWLGKRGRFADSGIGQMLQRRCIQAGLVTKDGKPLFHPHQFRHAYAHTMLNAGMQEGDLMRLAGWRSREMLARYGATAADERAREAYRRIQSPMGDI